MDTQTLLRDVADEIDNFSVIPADCRDKAAKFFADYKTANGDPDTLLSEGVETLVGILARVGLLRIDIVSDPALPRAQRRATAIFVVTCTSLANRDTFAFLDELCAHLGDKAPYRLAGGLAVKSKPAPVRILRNGRAVFAG
ncbi:hypothetical protein EBR66_08365 [bacterium]|nr:hypothetical protein [bacterium]